MEGEGIEFSARTSVYEFNNKSTCITFEPCVVRIYREMILLNAIVHTCG